MGADHGNGNGHGRIGYISWQQLVTVVLPIIVAIVTGGVVIANIMLTKMQEQLVSQYQEVRELTHTLYTVQTQLEVIRAHQSRFYKEERDRRDSPQDPEGPQREP